MKEVAIQFGRSLDQDDFEKTQRLLSPDCVYHIGEEILRGPQAICQSYEQNMLEGRKKLDELRWGESRIESISSSEFYVHFTDYLKHCGQEYTHRCRQKLSFNAQGQINKITHIADAEEEARLKTYYQKVGLA